MRTVSHGRELIAIPLDFATQNIVLTILAFASQNALHRGDQRFQRRESAMDQKTRNEFERLCALAEIEQGPEKFVEISRIEISRNIICILSEKQLSLNEQRPASRVRYRKAPSHAA